MISGVVYLLRIFKMFHELMNNPVYTVILATDVHNDIKGKSEGKSKSEVHPVTGHEVPEGEQRYSSTLSLISALDVWVVNATPRPLYPRERPGTHCIGGWVGLRDGLDWCRKSRLHRDSIPGPSSP